MNFASKIDERKTESSANAPASYDVVIVGAGPTGTWLARSLAKRAQRVALLNDEPWGPYNRVLLTPLLAGEVQFGQVAVDTSTSHAGVKTFSNVRVTDIDADAQLIEASNGHLFSYKSLILCTGSVPFVPPIPGADSQNVFTFRNAEDAAALKARSIAARNVVVIGGGLLGLEAARGMAQMGAKTTIIEHEARLMPRQLDEEGAATLAKSISALGVTPITGEQVAEIDSMQGRVAGVTLSDGRTIPADTVIVCTGVRPNVALARAAGLTCNKGIVVSRDMRTSDDRIFAAGECVECEGHIEGLVGPCLEQARIAADTILGKEAEYVRGSAATKLKVVGVDVFSMGPVENLSAETTSAIQTYHYADPNAGIYRRVFLSRDGRLAGAIGIGAWAEVNRLQAAIAEAQPVKFLERRRFKRTGLLWPAGGEDDPMSWAETAIVCNCTGVTKGQITAAIKAGAQSPPDITSETGASSVCGTCAPLVEELLGGNAPPQPMKFWKALTGLSAVALIIAVIIAIAPPIPFAQSFSATGLFEYLWLDNIAKQWTGYTLLAITGAAALIGLRKRIRFFDRLGGYAWWRAVHLGVGVLAGIGLFVHTGFRFGGNLTMALMVFFVASLVLGAIAGIATGQDHRLRAAGYGKATKPPRRLPVWAHIFLLWPIPVLVIAHVVAIYAY